MVSQKKALVLLSGGLDSAVLLWWAKKRGYSPATLTFQYPGRRSGEMKAIRALRRKSGSREHFDVPLPFLESPDPAKSNYIPHRNLVYYGIAASLARRIGAEAILGGHIRHDGAVFPDARPVYFKRVEKLLRDGRTRKSLKLRFPFIRSGKKRVIQKGVELGVPFAATWSCSREGSLHCWSCGSCRERLEGFERARVKDPLYDRV